jgi:Undecaprenyl-phosphate glucose phosphotransferase
MSGEALRSTGFTRQPTYLRQRSGASPASEARLRGVVAPQMLAGLIGLCDLCLIVAASAIPLFVYPQLTGGAVDQGRDCLLISLLAALMFVGAFHRIEGYAPRQLCDFRWQLVRVAAIWGLAIFLLLLGAFVAKITATYSRAWALSWIGLTAGFLGAERGLLRLVVERWVGAGYIARNIAVVGTTHAIERLLANLDRSKDKSIVVRGVFHISEQDESPAAGECAGSDHLDDLVRLVCQRAVEEVVIVLPLASGQLRTIVDRLQVLPIDLRISAEPLTEMFPIRGLTYLSDMPLLTIADRPLKHWNAVAKWLEDKLLGALLLALFGPLMAFIAVLIKCESRGPVLFKQERFGLSNEVFHCLKFRTMYVDRGDLSGAQRTVRNDLRVTPIGRILRRLSLDELPQLFNVLRGDMSLVGPRPHAVAMRAGDRRYVDAIETYSRRHRVKPGITGWAQVHGCRGEVDTMIKARARLDHDFFYIENWSIWLDVKTLLLTVPVLVVPRDTY